MQVLGFHIDVIPISLLLFYTACVLYWLFFSGDRSASKSSSQTTHKLIDPLNYSQWISSSSNDAMHPKCCKFIQHLTDPHLRYRYGTDSQSCCISPYNGTKPLSNLDFNGPKFVPLHFLSSLQNKRIVFLGDSLMRQTMTALICAMETKDILPTTIGRVDDVIDCVIDFQNGISLNRVSMIKFNAEAVRTWASKADVLIINFGAWYRRTQRLQYERDLSVAASIISKMNAYNSDEEKSVVVGGDTAAASKRVVGLFVDTMPSHFKTRRHSGDFFDRADDLSCVPLNPKSYAVGAGNWRTLSMRKLSQRARVPMVELADIFVPRYDMHMEHRPKLNNKGKPIKKLDCSHWCQRTNLWDPLLHRIHSAVDGILLGSFIVPPHATYSTSTNVNKKKQRALLPQSIRDASVRSFNAIAVNKVAIVTGAQKVEKEETQPLIAPIGKTNNKKNTIVATTTTVDPKSLLLPLLQQQQVQKNVESEEEENSSDKKLL